MGVWPSAILAAISHAETEHPSCNFISLVAGGIIRVQLLQDWYLFAERLKYSHNLSEMIERSVCTSLRAHGVSMKCPALFTQYFKGPLVQLVWL